MDNSSNCWCRIGNIDIDTNINFLSITFVEIYGTNVGGTSKIRAGHYFKMAATVPTGHFLCVKCHDCITKCTVRFTMGLKHPDYSSKACRGLSCITGVAP